MVNIIFIMLIFLLKNVNITKIMLTIILTINSKNIPIISVVSSKFGAHSVWPLSTTVLKNRDTILKKLNLSPGVLPRLLNLSITANSFRNMSTFRAYTKVDFSGPLKGRLLRTVLEHIILRFHFLVRNIRNNICYISLGLLGTLLHLQAF